MSNPGELRHCPTCRQSWPRGAEFDLRGFGWLDNLPRQITPDNVDCYFHDGAGGRDRFLVFETKRPGERMAGGQKWALRRLSCLPNVDVWVLHGTTGDLRIHRVQASGIEDGAPTTPALVRSAVVAWLDGGTFAPETKPVGNWDDLVWDSGELQEAWG